MTANTKGISLFALTMIAIGSTIGSGIFQTPASIAQSVPQPVYIMLLWIAGGLISMIGALVFAELGSRFPKAGGVYAYLNESYGELPAFLYGWCLLTVVSSGTIASLIVVFTDYMRYFVDFSDGMKPIVASAAIVVLTLFNIFGIKSSEWFANISTIIKIVGIYAILILALFLGDRAIFGEATAVVAPALDAAAQPETKTTWSSVANAFVGVLWSYTGWHYASFVSGEVVNPKHNVPIAMIVGSLVVMLTYVLCNAGYLSVLPLDAIQNSEALAADTMAAIFPGSTWVGPSMAILIAISVFGCAGLYVLATPRIIQQMSDQGMFFKAFSQKHPRFGVPLNAIVLQSVWAIILVFLWGKFEALYTYVTITEWFFLLAACISIFVVRYKLKSQPENVEQEKSIFKSPLYPILPILFVVVIGWFISMNLFVSEDGDKSVYFGLLTIPIGAVIYYIYKSNNK